MHNQPQIDKITVGDMFCGAGGTSHGLVNSDFAEVVWAINHDPDAIRAHKKNHPRTIHFEEDIVSMNIEKLTPVDLLWASLECTHFSQAKGGQSRDADSRMLARQMYRYIRHTNPFIVIIENVKEFLTWGPLITVIRNGKTIQVPDPLKKGTYYKDWVSTIKAMGYDYEYKMLNSADYGARTTRTRYFGVFVKKGLAISFPKPTHSKTGTNGLPKWLPCGDAIDLTNTGQSIFGRQFNENLPKNVRRPLSPNSIKRVVAGMKKFCIEGDLIYDPHFIMKYYGNGDNCTSLKKPLHTIPTLDRHLLVSLEKQQFVSEHFGTSRSIDQPMPTIMAFKDQKYMITTEYFSTAQYNAGDNPGSQVYSLSSPLNTIMTQNKHNLVTFEKAEFVSQFYGRDANVDVNNDPFPTVTTLNQNQLVTFEKMNFIQQYYNSTDNPGANISSIGDPLGSITTRLKENLVTVEKKFNYLIDVKTRFLTAEELKVIQGFSADYHLIGSQRAQKKGIGNSVVPLVAQALVEELWFQNHQLLYRKRA